MNLIQLARVDSTNDYAERLLENQDLPDWTVVLSREQYSGRGQHGNTWESSPGMNLTCTFVLKPTFLKASLQFMLNKAVSLGVHDTVCQLIDENSKANPRVRIKWPNDIFVDTKKVAGILIGHKIMGDNIHLSVVGIGLNLNQMNFSADLQHASSLKQLTGADYDILQVLQTMYDRIRTAYSLLEEGRYHELDDAYHPAMLGFRERRQFIINEQKFEGVITGVDESGLLIIETSTGEERRFMHREVEMLL